MPSVKLFLSEVLIRFEAWGKLAQQWLVCVPLGIHLNKQLMLLVTIIMIVINCNFLAQRENCAVPNKKLFGPMVCHISLSKTLIPKIKSFT